MQLCWAILNDVGAMMAHLGRSWALCWGPGVHVRPGWAHLGPAYVGLCWLYVGPLLAYISPILAHVGPVLALSPVSPGHRPRSLTSLSECQKNESFKPSANTPKMFNVTLTKGIGTGRPVKSWEAWLWTFGNFGKRGRRTQLKVSVVPPGHRPQSLTSLSEP